MPYKLSTKGFSLITVFVIILVLAGIGTAGYVVWSKNKKDEKKPTNTTQNNNGQTEPTDHSEGGKYLVIEEWGVRMPINESERGDIYYLAVESNGEGHLILGSRKLDSLLGNMSCSAIKNADGSFASGVNAGLTRLRYKDYDEATLNAYATQLNYVKKIGDHHYYSKKDSKNPPITCQSGNPAATSQSVAAEKSTVQMLNQAFLELNTY